MKGCRTISAVTEALRYRIQAHIPDDLSGTIVSTSPLDQIQEAIPEARINLLLFHVMPNPAARNIPAFAGGNAPVCPVIALNLFYLVSCYGPDEDSGIVSHRLLESALVSLQKDPVVSLPESMLSDSDVAPWIPEHRPGITVLGYTLQEISQVWAMLQSEHRLSFALEVSGILLK